MATNMEASKEVGVQVSNIDLGDNVNVYNNEGVIHTQSTYDDVTHMRRMGKDQVFVRNFRLFSIAAFTALATAAWELGIFLVSPALIDGGQPALMYGTIWTFVGFIPIYVSLAEMASMAPIAGAQYHWVSEFAPEGAQRILSYFTGWLSTIAWQGGNALGVILVGTLCQAIIQINVPDYAFPPWHAALLAVAATVVAFVGTVFGSKLLPRWPTALFIIHVAGYLYFLIPPWVNAPKASHSQVWTEFTNSGGWPGMGLTLLVGQLTGIFNVVGVDTAAHMAEEVKDAASQVPKAMIMVYFMNIAMILPAMLTIAYHIPVIDDALNDPTLYPAIYVLRQSMPPGAVTGLLVVIIAVMIASNITYLAAVTRDLFAFARDKGLPFSDWIAKVDPKREIPVNAATLTSILSIAMSMIYLGSPVAYYAVTSLCVVALLQCYCFSIGCLLWRRIRHPETLPPARFSLGRLGIPINIISLILSVWFFFWSFWPQSTPVTASGFNWAAVIFVAVLIVAVIHFVLVGRKNYHGPVTSVEGRKVHAT